MPNWKPATCDCILIFYDLKTNNNGNPNNFRGAYQKCALHKNSSGLALFNAVLAHNRSFNLKYGHIELTEAQAKEINIDCANEKARIKAMGESVRI